MTHQFARYLVPVIASAVFISGCSGSGSGSNRADTGKQSATKPSAPVKGGTLTIAINGQVVSIDAHQQADWNSMGAVFNLYDGLLTVDSKNELRPLLAEKWEASPDGKRFTFTIRKGAKYHDGTPITAKTLKSNLERVLSADLKSPQKADYDKLDKIEAPDDEHLIISWQTPTEPIQFFANRVSSPWALSPDVAAAKGKDFALAPVGSGPFKFESYTADDRLVLVRNDDYWAGAPYLDKLVARIIPDANTRRVEMEAGTIDVLMDVPPKDVQALKDKGMKITRGPAAGMQALALNLSKAPMNDLLVRKAVAYAIPKDALIKKVLFDYATPSVTGTHPASWGVNTDVKGYDFNPEQAKKLLDDAGWKPGPDGIRVKDGKRLAITYAARNDETWMLIAQTVQESLKNIGIDVTIDAKDWGAFLEAMRAGNYDVAYWSLGGYSFEPQGFTWNLRSTAYWNVSQINKSPETKALSKQIDDLLNAGEAEIASKEKRGQIYKEFQKQIVDNVLMVPLWHLDRVTAVQPWVEGLDVPTLISSVRAEKAWINPAAKQK
ncbi:MAG: peptide transporter substrate-binding protein [Firmicutes bacterium]|nr:peptide transporter substrate-binding protein [Bacillota bacterium]